MKRRLIVLGMALITLGATVVIWIRAESHPPFSFIHGSKVRTDSLEEDGEKYYMDYYVFPAAVQEVQNEASEELSSLGYMTFTGDNSGWYSNRRNIINVTIGDRKTWPGNELEEVPIGSVVVEVQRNEPSIIERVREWAHRIGL